MKKILIISEIGINHNGDLNLAFELIKICKDNGFDAVKFQKRVPELCVPIEKRDEIRNTPWGKMTYFDYKKKIEFSKNEYDKMINNGYNNIIYLETQSALGNDFEGTVDAVHFTDLGFIRYSDFLVKKFEELELFK